MQRYPLIGVEQLAEGDTQLFDLADKKILVYRLSDGVFATSASCTHLFKSLAKGKIVDDTAVVCPLHRAQFDIRSGAVINWACFPPGVQLLNSLRPEKALSSYAVEEEGGLYYIAL
jgi:3-phenylpropionate/trans-cinnamate dioxygenase ferredoxin subunit